MSFLYLANIRLPTEKAHGIQIMKMCEAWAKSGQTVELVIPWRLNPIKSDPFAYYGVSRDFAVKRLPALDLIKLGRVGFWLHLFSFSVAAFFYVLKSPADVIYSRDELPLFFASLMRKNIYWEGHTGQSNLAVRFLLSRCRGIITITQGLKDLYIKKFNMPPEKIKVAPDGVDLENFTVVSSKEACRRELNLPLEKKLVVYTGHLYDWKGAQILADAASALPAGIEIIFVGGTTKDVAAFCEKNKNYGNISILGQKPHQQMPLYLKAADILVIPNSAQSQVSSFYTSPLKLFEYMASGTPIVASDLPSIREILSDKEAYFFTPDQPQSLAKAILSSLTNPEKSLVKSGLAKIKVHDYTWQARADSIAKFVRGF